jgi:hypothetical protein
MTLFEAVRLLQAKRGARRIVELAKTSPEVRHIVCTWRTPWTDLIMQLVHTENIRIDASGGWDVRLAAEVSTGRLTTEAAATSANECDALQLALYVVDNYIHLKEHLLKELFLGGMQSGASSEPEWVDGMLADSQRLAALRAKPRDDLEPDQMLFTLFASRLFRWLGTRPEVIAALNDDALIRMARFTKVLGGMPWATPAISVYATLMLDGRGGRGDGCVAEAYVSILINMQREEKLMPHIASDERCRRLIKSVLLAAPFVDAIGDRAILFEIVAVAAARCLPTAAPIAIDGSGTSTEAALFERAVVHTAESVAEEGDVADVVMFVISVCRAIVAVSVACDAARPLLALHATLTELLTAAARKVGGETPAPLSMSLRRVCTRFRGDFAAMDACCSDEDRNVWWWALDVETVPPRIPLDPPPTTDAISGHPLLATEPAYFFEGNEGQPLRLESVLRFEDRHTNTVKNPFTNLYVQWGTIGHTG